MLDVDNFKKYNDRYGHLAGDDCLCAIAAALAGAVEESNGAGLTAGAFAARYGGEEFAVIIPDASQAGYRALAERCVAAVRGLAIPHELNADWGVVTVSVGGMRSDPASGAILALFRAADEQLYRAKENGRNRAQLG